MKQTSHSGFDIVTIGSATRDVFVWSSHFEQKKDKKAPDGWDACLPFGAKIPIDKILFETGGGATNAAVTFARAGYKTACISRVGDDMGGHEVVAQLKREKINTRGIEHDPKYSTAYSIILLSKNGSRAILTARGASKHLIENTIPWKRLSSQWIYLTSLAGDRRLLREIFSHAKRTKIHIAWNPGSAEISLGLKSLLPYLMQSGIVTLNREEAAALADVSPRQLDRIFTALGSLPQIALVVTDGPHGAYAYAHGNIWYAPAANGKAINTTGAGDAFGSGFVAALMKDNNIIHALKAGTLNALGVVTHMGAKAGILKHKPTKRDLARVKITEYV